MACQFSSEAWASILSETRQPVDVLLRYLVIVVSLCLLSLESEGRHLTVSPPGKHTPGDDGF